MVTAGVLARFEFRADDESAAELFFRSGKPIVERQPPATVWFAYRLGPALYGAFAAFASAEDRQALLSPGGHHRGEASRKPALSRRGTLWDGKPARLSGNAS